MYEPVDQKSDVQYEKLLNRAAVSGAFDPVGLSNGLVDQSDPDHETQYNRMLNRLAGQCDEIKVGNLFGWVLKSKQRSEVLSGLKPNQIDGLINEVSDSIYEDEFGGFLRDALLQHEVAVTKLTDDELTKYRRALGFSVEVHPNQKKLERAVRGRVATRDDNHALKTAMPKILLGRDDKYQTLLNYMRTGKMVPEEEASSNDLDSIVTNQVPASKASCLLITGVGGSGKSALLSTFIYKSRRWPQNPPIILIDFDGPVFADNSVIDLTFELSRKIGQHLPETDSALSEFRSKVRASQEEANNRDTSSYEYWQVAHENSMSLLASLIAKHNLTKTKVTLVLDTFEEVLVRGEFLADPVFRWLDDLKFMAGLENLRVIISGRAAPDTKWHQVGQRFVGHVEVGDLKAEPAAEMLELLKVPILTGKPFVETFGGNPLVLIIFSRFYHENPIAEVNLLLKSGKENGGKLQGEIAQRFLYDRILNRIQDEKVKALAHPGLVLRRVTVDLIDKVLRGACNLAEDEDFDAEDLFNRLSRQVWLVRKGTGRYVEHRKDLRRLMLTGLIEDREQPADQINQAAIEFYDNGLDDFLTPQDQKFESAYHQILLGKVPDFSPEMTQSFLNRIGADVEDFTPKMLGRLKVKAEQLDTIVPAELNELDDTDFEKAARFSQSAHLKVGANTASSELGGRVASFSGRGALPPRFGSPGIDEEQSELLETSDERLTHEDVSSAFATCDFEKLLFHSPGVLNTFVPYLRLEEKSKSSSEFLFSDWWRTALGVRAQLPDENILERIPALLKLNESLTEYLTDPPGSAFKPYEESQSLSRLALAAAMARCLGFDSAMDAATDCANQKIPLSNQGKSPNLWFTGTQLQNFGEKRFLDIASNKSIGWDTKQGKLISARLYQYLSPAFAKTLVSQYSIRSDKWIEAYQGFFEARDNHTLSEINGLGGTFREEYISASSEEPGPNSGILPELHSLINFALKDAAGQGWDYTTTIAKVESRARVWPKEFTQWKTDGGLDLERWSTSLVSVCDNLGLLQFLVTEAYKSHPSFGALEKVARLVTKYSRLLS